MIFRLSQKLSKKIKVAPKSVAPPDENLFADWSAHLFTADHTQYIILTNTQSLYSMVMPGKGITDDRRFFDAAIAYIRESLCAAGMEFIFRNFIETGEQGGRLLQTTESVSHRVDERPSLSGEVPVDGAGGVILGGLITA